MRLWRRTMLASVFAVVLGLALTQPARADPAPGFEFDPVVLVQRMDACMEFVVPPNELLMGWVNLARGQTREWRCSSLRHMILDAEDRVPPVVHDPFVGPLDFMLCADKAIGGFPRPASEPWNTRYIYQYQGTARRANVIVNSATGDVVSFYTEPNNDWAACAHGL